MRRIILFSILLISTGHQSLATESSRSELLQRQERILSRFSPNRSHATREGLPTPGDLPDPSENIATAYSTATLIEMAIDQAQVLPLGSRIPHYRQMAINIVEKSSTRPNEEIIRMTLNRANDVIDAILPVMGQNPSLVAQWTANFYEENLKLAKMFANNGTRFQRGFSSSIGSSSQASIAEYGRIYSTLLWRFSTSLTSQTSKAILLMKLISYLGYDVNLDPARDSNSLKEVLADVVRLQQTNTNYQRILGEIDHNVEPTTVNLLRSDIYYILQKLPARLNQAGIQSLGTN